MKRALKWVFGIFWGLIVIGLIFGESTDTKSKAKVEVTTQPSHTELVKNQDHNSTEKSTSVYDENIQAINTFSTVIYSMSEDAVIETNQLGSLIAKSPDDRYAIYQKASSIVKTLEYNNSKFKEHLETNHGKNVNKALNFYINGNDKYIAFLKNIAYMADENVGLKPSELQTAIDKLGQAKLDFAKAGNEMRKHLVELGVKESDINEHGYIEK